MKDAEHGRRLARSAGRLALWTVALLLMGWAAERAGVDTTRLFSDTGQENAQAILEGLQHPDTSPDFVDRVVQLTRESLAIGALGMLLALVLGIPLALISAQIPELSDPPARNRVLSAGRAIVRWVARLVLAALRSIPEIVWAFLFVRILGLGPGPAVIAIGLSFGGIIGKLYAELMEAADPGPVRALRAAGCSRWASLAYGVLPQVRAQWVGYGLFRFECAIRSAAILGVVGAGGIGAEIDLSIRYFQYDKLATALLAVLACVFAFELASIALRRVRAAWSLGLLAVGVLWGDALLGIPWGELFTDFAVEQARLFIQAFNHPSTDPELLGRAWELVLETLAMAIVGTGAAAIVAFVLAPLATVNLTVGRFSSDAPAGRQWWRLPGLALLLASRGVFQLTRALPELVWALLFVVWVGPGPFAGALAVGAHTIGILGRLYGEVYDEVEPLPARALEHSGASRLGVWSYAVLPQVAPRLLSFTLFRFEVNVRATAMVGFVGAGGIGDALHTAISLFHMGDLATLLLVLLATVAAVDFAGDRLRRRLLT